MDNEIRSILDKTPDGQRVLEYIEELEEHIAHHHHHDENCHCHDHEHDDDCDCGCHDHDEEDEWQEIETGYKNKLSVKDWEKLLRDEKIFNRDSLVILKRIRHIAAPTSYMELADTFGLGAFYYEMEMDNLAKRLLPIVNAQNLKKPDYLSVIFNSWKNKNIPDDVINALRPELYEALGNVDLSKIPLRENQI